MIEKNILRATIAFLLVTSFAYALHIQSARADNLILELSANKTTANIGEKIDFTLKLRNLGDGPVTLTFTPPLLDLSYYSPQGFFKWSDGMCFIQVILTLTLSPGQNYSQTLRWDLYQYWGGARHLPQPGTYFVGGICYPAGMGSLSSVAVTLVQWNPCDVNYDLKIDIRDLAIAAIAFGSCLDHPRWNQIVDLNSDGKIDIRDLARIAVNYGKTCTT